MVDNIKVFKWIYKLKSFFNTDKQFLEFSNCFLIMKNHWIAQININTIPSVCLETPCKKRINFKTFKYVNLSSIKLFS